MKVYNKVLEVLTSDGCAHFTLIDPTKQKPDEAGELAEKADSFGTDAIMVGGSIGVSTPLVDETCKKIKKMTEKPIILFPGDIGGLSKYADAVFFMSLLNSMNPYYITGAQALGAPIIKKMGIEPLPMAYIIIEPGGTVGWIGNARPIPRDKPEIAAAYALAGEYLGMKLVYLEGGSGVKEPVPEEMIKAVKRLIDIPLVIGGGIKTPEDAEQCVVAGADIIVTGTLLEREINKLEVLIRFLKEAGRKRINKR
ncbi:MAG: geranylgeranylglyceryl/heptaprenylglyceryl phosphate synthase [Candidatus Hydrothermarchaeota archaeon]